MTVGETITFFASVTDTSGASVDTTVTWAVTGNIGAVDTNGLFTASNAGSGTVTATLAGVVDAFGGIYYDQVNNELIAGDRGPGTEGLKIFGSNNTLTDSINTKLAPYDVISISW